jgi:hypothetical protein
MFQKLNEHDQITYFKTNKHIYSFGFRILLFTFNKVNNDKKKNIRGSAVWKKSCYTLHNIKVKIQFNTFQVLKSMQHNKKC